MKGAPRIDFLKSILKVGFLKRILRIGSVTGTLRVDSLRQILRIDFVKEAIRKVYGKVADMLNLKLVDEGQKQRETAFERKNIRGLLEGYRAVELGQSSRVFVTEPTERVYFSDDEEYAPTIRASRSEPGVSANLPASERRSICFEEPSRMFANARKRPVYEKVNYNQFTVKRDVPRPAIEDVEIEAPAPVVKVSDLPIREPAEERPSEIPVPMVGADVIEEEVLLEPELQTVQAKTVSEPVYYEMPFEEHFETVQVPVAPVAADAEDSNVGMEAEELRENEVDVAIKEEEVLSQDPIFVPNTEEPFAEIQPIVEEFPAVSAEPTVEEPVIVAGHVVDRIQVADSEPVVNAEVIVAVKSVPTSIRIAEKPVVEGLYTNGDNEIDTSAIGAKDIVGINGSLLEPQMTVTSGSGAEAPKTAFVGLEELPAESEPVFDIRNENRDYLMAFVPDLVDEEFEMNTSEDVGATIPDDGLESFDEEFMFRNVKPAVAVADAMPVSKEFVKEEAVPVPFRPVAIDISAVAAVIDGLFDD